MTHCLQRVNILRKKSIRLETREFFILIFEIFENSVHLFFRKYRMFVGKNRTMRGKTLNNLRVKY